MMQSREEINGLISLRLKALRLSKSKTAGELAKAIGKGQHTITRVENGVSELTAVELVLLARALDVKVSVLVGEQSAAGGDGE